MRAGQINHDEELGIIVATGGVEIAQGERFLLADTLSYNQKTDTVTASGNIKILEPSGEVIFAEYLELHDQMRDGAIREIRILMDDNARIAANGARRVGGTVSIMSKGVYSPCDVCKDTPDEAPLWQVKADRIIHDQEAKTVEYHDATLEFFGVPVVYTPYLTHPDPSVRRKSGFLAPSFGTTSSAVGTFVRTPYFWALSDDKDITFDPIITTDTSPIIAAEYRQAFDNGEMELSGSVVVADRKAGDENDTYTKEDRVRGHIFGTGRFDIDDTYRWGFDIERTFDKTYLSKFNFFENPGNSLTSSAFIEGFRQRNYMAASVYDFQDLRDDSTAPTPVIFPNLEYTGFGEADRYGGRWDATAGFRGLSERDESDNIRLSFDIGYSLPIASSLGYITTLSAKLNSDLYFVDHSTSTNSLGQTEEDGVTGRLVPQLAAEWQYPFYRPLEDLGHQMIEPVAGVFIAPNGGNSSNINNDDSTVVEEDDTNLFSMDRIAGRDRMETGSRVAYGVKAGHYFNATDHVEFFLGQSYRLTDNNALEAETGLQNGASDYFGWINISPHKYAQLNYRFAMDESDFNTTRNEVSLSGGTDAFGFTLTYTDIEKASASSSEIQEIQASARAKFDDEWSGRLFGKRNLQDNTDGGSINSGFGIKYEDECFIFDSSFTRSFVHQTDVNANDTLFFRLTFKTLGEVTI
ncbi:LPS-assembly protein LptD [Aestuariispira insulae]|uniref:LPS-assembly protein LptD n=1 Tax=Aestuariispira insulae TaxID=1461337 RepID=UPI0015F251B6|nr:LPS assembly protein LptD [Aestuariispira insulae]